MLYEFSVYQMKVEEHLFWVAESKTLNGCVGQGETSDEAIQELEENEREWLDTAKEFNIPVPPLSCRKEKAYSGKLALRMSPYVHEKAAETAQNLGISLNQFVNDAIIEYTATVNRSYNKQTVDDPNIETSSRIVQFPVASVSPYTNIQEKLEEM